MDNIIIKNKTIKEEFNHIIDTYYKKIPSEYTTFVWMVLVNFKKNSNNEDFLVLILLYGLIFFKKINIDNEHINKKNREYIEKLKEIYKYATLGDKNNFLKAIYNMDPELCKLKMIIKYSVILFENKSYNKIIICDRTNYYKSIGYIIPYLTLQESNLLSFFQDAYFKKLYPDSYIKTKMLYLEKMQKSTTPEGYIISIVNNLNEALDETGVSGSMSMRKKSYFSIYNKIKNKQNTDFLDSIGVRIIFKNLEELRKYEQRFEDKFIYSQKKDYIEKPKNNGYQSLHYSFMTPYANNEVYVELQLRTEDMDKNIHNAKELSHYTYTIKKNKWNNLFVEVDYGYKHLVKYIEKNKK